ncbi:hypothetical protein A9Z06_33520 [Rhizobium sp. YK2]|nr:hypothetical protein A9Z06_33520 [Rhizobium sp. YK2]
MQNGSVAYFWPRLRSTAAHQQLLKGVEPTTYLSILSNKVHLGFLVGSRAQDRRSADTSVKSVTNCELVAKVMAGACMITRPREWPQQIKEAIVAQQDPISSNTVS